jgi:hypothetical protein
MYSISGTQFANVPMISANDGGRAAEVVERDHE